MRTLLLLGFSFLCAPAFASEPPPAEKAPPAATSKGKAKPGAACKTNADCDQSGLSQSCVKSKCVQDPTPPPPT